MNDKWECKDCGTIISGSEGKKPKCSCDSTRLRKLEVAEEMASETSYTREQVVEAIEKFKDVNLLHKIHLELNKGHIGDDNAKLTNFLTCGTGLLKNDKRRQSNAITGDSSVGKNNLMENNLLHFPNGSYIYVSSATQSTIEEDIKDIPIIAFKEVNFSRENGANKHLLEVYKQVVEGGTSSLKKDARTGFKTARHDISEQKVVVYPTTESQRDEEAETRNIFVGIDSDPEKIKKVNDNTLDSFADLDKLLSNLKKEDSWIKVGLTHFWNNKKPFEVYLPYARFLKENINNKPIFDNNSARSQRDIKRLLSLTCFVTWLFQLQREKIKYNGKNFLISKPQDFINTLKISGEFFNQTYSGLDPRLMEVLKIIDKETTDWVARDLIQKNIGISRNTIKGYCDSLSNEGLIEGTTGKLLNEQEGIRIYDGNKSYYRRCQKGIKKPLIRCQINELKTFLEEKTKETIDTFEFLGLSSVNEEKEDRKGVKIEGVNSQENRLDSISLDKIDTFSLTPFEVLKDFSDLVLPENWEQEESIVKVLIEGGYIKKKDSVVSTSKNIADMNPEEFTEQIKRFNKEHES